MTIDTLEALREAREALEMARPYVADMPIVGDEDVAKIDATLSRIDAALASDHIGNSTTMVPALGVEGVAQIKATIWKHWRNQNGQTLEDRFTAAAEEIAAMEKNDGEAQE